MPQRMFTMREDAIMKALAGKIPFQEVDTLGGALLADEEVETLPDENADQAAS
jgi:hypothetical protein